ncbi:hypothetical protein PB1_13724 [Bacillus methanolicus PB1]|uniref:Sirohydrochlorin ferrochelatase n=1 Tax=Bacillus methanolicus PB1 TaxID=997296 RepID=I3DWK0_BACMT|nr:hypothetical protein [Bacillus methanolicus]EIJ78621.1 hypothetical protein PB1_13724 [Bacillus methanolicus PB1]
MEAILYICHGSRVKKACEQAIDFIKKCMDQNPEKKIHHPISALYKNFNEYH